MKCNFHTILIKTTNFFMYLISTVVCAVQTATKYQHNVLKQKTEWKQLNVWLLETAVDVYICDKLWTFREVLNIDRF
jgi:hypothetical protein